MYAFQGFLIDLFYKNKMILYILLTFILLFICSNALDAYVSKRPVIAQTALYTALTAPLNAATHLSTPQWLKDKLSLTGILEPNTQLFPSVEKLRANIEVIRKEALASVAVTKQIKHDLYFQGIADDGWKRLYIKWHGPIDPLARQHCPVTCSLIDSMPEVHVAMFSVLEPGSKILPHHGPAKMCLRYHLGLSTPNDDKCRITLNGETYSWRDGEDVMFDDTLIHEVHNDTDTRRIVLFLDVERPQEGMLKSVSAWTMKHLGPLTTRANEENEKVVKN
jgi:beta-hydroxylase